MIQQPNFPHLINLIRNSTSSTLITLCTSIPSGAEFYITFNLLCIRHKHLNKGPGQCKSNNLYSINQKNNFLKCMTIVNYINNVLNVGNE